MPKQPQKPQKPQKPRKPRKLKDPALLAEEAAFKLAAGRRLFMCRMLIIDNRTWFADKMGVTMTRWRMWEEGAHDMDLRVMARFCDMYPFTADWVVLGRYETLPPNARAALADMFPDEIQPYIAAMTQLRPASSSGGREVLPLPPPQSLKTANSTPSAGVVRKKRPRNFRQVKPSI